VDLGTGQVPKQLAAGDSFTCALLASGQVKCWGADNRGQLGLSNDGFDSRTSRRQLFQSVRHRRLQRNAAKATVDLPGESRGVLVATAQRASASSER
jgi:alpha-tubulin suppressor-like RCC1 family protein